MTAASSSLTCAAEEVSAKATEFSTEIQELAAKDPQKVSGAQSQLTTDPESACKVYDDILADLK